MSERLPTTVMCCACGKTAPAMKARRRITLWARIGKGGSLSGIKDQVASDVYRCDECVAAGRHPDDQTRQEAML